MKVLVTGAGGMLGHDVVDRAEAVHHEVVAMTRDDLDVTDAERVARVVRTELPHTVINCAAYTAVDLAEDDEQTAHAVNAEGAANVAAAAAEIDARVFYISTDYVFDGTKGEPYVESDAPHPLSAYGRSKLAGEQRTIEANVRHTIIRTSWLFGLHGKNFVETMLRLAGQQSEVLVVRDQVGCPTYTRHLAEAIVELLDYETLGVLHIAGSGYCTWWDFAIEIFRQTQVECKVLSSTTEMLARPAPRPTFAALESERSDALLLPRWDHGLHEYLVERAQVAANATQSSESQ
jgi:dTDP-4-dehydrorhamnose reductase